MHPAAPDWSSDWSPAGRSWPARIRTALERARDWLDARGRGAWIAAMVVGFVLFWPVGLALLFYMFWSERMTCKSWGRRARHMTPMQMGSTGNAAFDAYRAETLKRLEDEREAFTAFLDQLRKAKDQAEFDQFMASRRAPSPEVAA